MKKQDYKITIGWLYPELMSTYGDRGNILVLQKRAEWRRIDIKVERIDLNTSYQLLPSCDLLFMGGAQDIQQEIVQKDLSGPKGKIVSSMIESNTPALFICGAYQFLGNYYKDAYGTRIPGLGVFDMHTESSKDQLRLIGNIVVKSKQLKAFIIGFENHGGRTILKNPNQAFAKVVKGSGNNGTDQTEGIHYKSTIGTYLHGPILPQNPQIADYLLENALMKKYGEEVKLTPLDDTLAEKAKLNILKRLKASY